MNSVRCGCFKNQQKNANVIGSISTIMMVIGGDEDEDDDDGGGDV